MTKNEKLSELLKKYRTTLKYEDYLEYERVKKLPDDTAFVDDVKEEEPAKPVNRHDNFNPKKHRKGGDK